MLDVPWLFAHYFIEQIGESDGAASCRLPRAVSSSPLISSVGFIHFLLLYISNDRCFHSIKVLA